MSNVHFPLEGVTVVELGGSKAVKLATRFLAGYGAQVLIADSTLGVHGEAQKFFFDAGKQPLEGDLVQAVRSADVLVTDLTEEGRAAKSIGKAALAEANTIVISVTPYGETGIGANWPASELTQFASGGQMATLGDRGREPLQAWGNQAEAQASLHVFGAVMASLIRRERHGITDSAIDISVQEVQASALEFFGGLAFNQDAFPPMFAPAPGGNALHALWAMYQCADGLVGIHVNAPNMVAMFDALGRPDLLERTSDPEYMQSEELKTIIADWVKPMTKDEFMHIADKFGVPFSYVATAQDLLDSEVVASTGLWREATTKDGQVIRVPGPMSDSALGFEHVPK